MGRGIALRPHLQRCLLARLCQACVVDLGQAGLVGDHLGDQCMGCGKSLACFLLEVLGDSGVDVQLGERADDVRGEQRCSAWHWFEQEPAQVGVELGSPPQPAIKRSFLTGHG